MIWTIKPIMSNWVANMRDLDFRQLCIWEGTLVGESEYDDFQKYIKAELGLKNNICLVGTVVTLLGNRSDFCFLMHKDDIPNSALKRLMLGIRWWEDVLCNGAGELYPQAFQDAYPALW